MAVINDARASCSRACPGPAQPRACSAWTERRGTLNNLRWLAVVGQTVSSWWYASLNLDFPVLNAAADWSKRSIERDSAVAYPSAKRLSLKDRIPAYDIVQLACLFSPAASKSFRSSVLGAGGCVGGNAGCGEHGVSRRPRICSNICARRGSPSTALVARQSAAFAGTVSSGHLGIAGLGHRVHVDVCMAHRERSDAHVAPYGRLGAAAASIAWRAWAVLRPRPPRIGNAAWHHCRGCASRTRAVH